MSVNTTKTTTTINGKASERTATKGRGRPGVNGKAAKAGGKPTKPATAKGAGGPKANGSLPGERLLDFARCPGCTLPARVVATRDLCGPLARLDRTKLYVHTGQEEGERQALLGRALACASAGCAPASAVAPVTAPKPEPKPANGTGPVPAELLEQIRPLAFTPCGGGCPLRSSKVVVVPDLGGPKSVLAGDLVVVQDRGSDKANLALACAATHCQEVRAEEPAVPDSRFTPREKFLRAIAARRKELAAGVVLMAVGTRNREAKRDLARIKAIEEQLALMKRSAEIDLDDTTNELRWYTARWEAARDHAAKVEADLRASPRPVRRAPRVNANA